MLYFNTKFTKHTKNTSNSKQKMIIWISSRYTTCASKDTLKKARGTWVAQPVEHDFSSDQDLAVHEFEPCVWLSAVSLSAQSLLLILCPPLSAVPHACALPKIKKNIEKKKSEKATPRMGENICKSYILKKTCVQTI